MLEGSSKNRELRKERKNCFSKKVWSNTAIWWEQIDKRDKGNEKKAAPSWKRGIKLSKGNFLAYFKARKALNHYSSAKSINQRL